MSSPPGASVFRLGHPLLALVEGCMGSDLEDVLEQYHRAVEAVVKGILAPGAALVPARRRDAREPARAACARLD